ELLLTDGEPGVKALVIRRHQGGEVEYVEAAPLDVAGEFWPRAFSEREPFEVTVRRAPVPQRRELESLGLAMYLVAPLVAPHACLGTLRIGFRGEVKMRSRELQVFSTFANQVTTSVHNARLFGETNEERAKLSSILDNTTDGILSVDGAGL